jgi:D-3-phosphoglycerate dehydrogenase
VTLHVPLSPTTENLISEAQLAKMKKGSYLLNASRGTVVRLLSRLAAVQLLMLHFVQVNIPDLAKALQSGRLAGACASVTPSPCM